MTNLAQVLERLDSAGTKLKKEKRHIISAEGLCPVASKVKAIKEAPKPSSLSKLNSFLGLVNYYAKFSPNSATILAPLYKEKF